MQVKNMEHGNCVDVKFDIEEVKCLCGALYDAYYDSKDDPIFRKLYSNLLVTRDICQYGHLDDFALANAVSCRDIHKISEQAEEIDHARKEDA